MNITDYSGLKQAIANWIDRDDLTEEIPNFIALAESEFNRRFRLMDMVTRVFATARDQYLAIPPKMSQAKNIQINSNPPSPLKYVSADIMDEYRFKGNNAKGKPCFYTVVGEQFEFYPTPDAEYEIEVAYYKDIPALTDQSPVNFFLLRYPDVYLYASLKHTAPYLKEDERLQLWGTLAEQSMEEVIRADIRRRSGASTIKQKARVFG